MPGLGGDGDFVLRGQRWEGDKALQTDGAGCINSEPSTAAKHPEGMRIHRLQKERTVLVRDLPVCMGEGKTGPREGSISGQRKASLEGTEVSK